MPEQPGDFLRVGADLIEGWLADDRVLRAEAITRSTGESHTCPLAAVALFLAQTLAGAAGSASEDLAPMLTEWRATAAKLDTAAGGPSPN